MAVENNGGVTKNRPKVPVGKTLFLLDAFAWIIAVFLAWNPDSSVFKIVSFAWAGFGAAFGPVMLLALFWKRSNMAGALAGMVTGGVMVFLWKYVISKLGGAFAIYELLPAFVLALIVNIVVSLCTKAPDKEIQDIFDEVKNPVEEVTTENA